jgi:hypothetical protein
MGREDYSRMVHFFGRRLFSSRGVFPLFAIALGFFPGRGRREGVNDGSVYEWICRAPESYFLAVEMHRE